MQEALSRLLAGKTVLVIAHRMRTVEAADKIVVLANGMVTECGSPAELETYYKAARSRQIELHFSEQQTMMAGVPGREQADIWRKIKSLS